MGSCQESGELGKVNKAHIVLSEEKCICIHHIMNDLFVVQLFGAKTAPQCMLVCRASGVLRFCECIDFNIVIHL